jgi:hypothetical protein
LPRRYCPLDTFALDKARDGFVRRYLPHLIVLVLAVAVAFIVTQCQVVQWSAEREVQQQNR